MMGWIMLGDVVRDFDAFRHGRELRRLRRLARGEPILDTVSGRDLKGSGVLALTPSRVLWIAGLRKRVFRLAQIRGVRAGTDRAQGVVTLEQPGLELAIARVPPDEAHRFAERTKQAARDAGNRSIETRTVDDRPKEERPMDAEAAGARLQRLERMLERGSITYPEYLANRRRVLERAEPPPEPPRASWWRRF